MGCVDDGLQPIYHRKEWWECPVCHDAFDSEAACARGLAYVPQAPSWLKVGGRVRTKSGAFAGEITAVKVLNRGGQSRGGHVHEMEITMQISPLGSFNYYRISEGRDESGQLEPV